MLGFKVHSGELELLIPSPGFPCPFQPGSWSGRQGNPTLHVSILFFLLSGSRYSNFLLNVPQLQEMKGKGWCPLPRLPPLLRSSWPGSSGDFPCYRGVLDKVPNLVQNGWFTVLHNATGMGQGAPRLLDGGGEQWGYGQGTMALRAQIRGNVSAEV